MPHETSLITTIVSGLVVAFVFGAIANRLRMPPLVGYLIAGILLGPATPGFVADLELAPQLAEIGVVLLMFGVGLHFSLKDLLSVSAIAIPGAIVQIAFATLLGWGLGSWMGWSVGGGLVFGLALSVASTVVLLKALQERRLVETQRGTIAVGWLIVEDIAMVLALVLIPAAASIATGERGESDATLALVARLLGVDLGIGGIILLTLLKIAAFVAVMLVIGRRAIPWILQRTANTGSRELFRLGVLAIALGAAFGSATLFGVSLALGAFFAGMILSESELSQSAAQESLPLRDAFAVLFFVSVGMLFDPSILIEQPLMVLATVFIIVIGKSVAAFVIVLAFGKSVGTALTISASLAQIGEFSFILAELGIGLGLLPEEGRALILAGAIISIILNPIVFWTANRMKPALEARILRGAPAAAVPANAPASEAAPSQTAPSEMAATRASSEPEEATADRLDEPPRPDEIHPSTLSDHVILVGFGRVGALVGADLERAGLPFLVIEDADLRLDLLRARGIEAIFGNAASADVLALANLTDARSIVIAIPNAFEAGQIVQTARKANPGLLIVARAHSDAEVEHLLKFGADTVIMGEREIARGMIDRLSAPPSAAAPPRDGDPKIEPEVVSPEPVAPEPAAETDQRA